MSDDIEKIIINSIDKYDDSNNLDSSPFEELISMGELIDRLSIVNLKLYNLKNEVLARLDDIEFKSWSALEDTRLVKERARLKKCIDSKIIHIINRVVNGDQNGGFNPEVKNYRSKL